MPEFNENGAASNASQSDMTRHLPSNRLRAVEGDKFILSLHGLRLSVGHYHLCMSGHQLPTDEKRPLAVELPGSLDGARFEIGEVHFHDATAKLIIFGPLDFEAEHLVF